MLRVVEAEYRFPIRWDFPAKVSRRRASLDRLHRDLETVAKLVNIDPDYLPIFHRLETEIAMTEAMQIADDPVARARAIAAARRAA